MGSFDDSYRGFNLIHHSCQLGKKSSLACLLSHSAFRSHIDDKTKHKSTAAHLAATSDRRDCLLELIKYGANLNVPVWFILLITVLTREGFRWIYTFTLCLKEIPPPNCEGLTWYSKSECGSTWQPWQGTLSHISFSCLFNGCLRLHFILLLKESY